QSAPSATPSTTGYAASRASQPPPSASPAAAGSAPARRAQTVPTPAASAATQPQPTPPPGRPPLVRSLEPAKPLQPPEPLFQTVNRPTPPLEPTDVKFPINLATALRLADARPIVVAAAQAGVWVAEAQLTRARVLWIPTLNIGFDYIRHDG